MNLVEQLRQVDVNVQGTDVRLGVTGLTGGNIDVSNTAGAETAAVFGGRHGSVVYRADSGVPFNSGAAGCFNRVPLLNSGQLRCRGCGLPDGLHGYHLRGARSRSDPGVPAHPDDWYPLRSGDGLSVFLVSGMREAYVHGKDAKTAVVAGYNHAVRVVVAA